MVINPARLSKLRWRCRRGMKELDILLSTFIDKNQEALSNGAWPELESLLDLEDDLLWDYLRLPESSEQSGFSDLIQAILQSQSGSS